MWFLDKFWIKSVPEVIYLTKFISLTYNHGHGIGSLGDELSQFRSFNTGWGEQKKHHENTSHPLLHIAKRLEGVSKTKS